MNCRLYIGLDVQNGQPWKRQDALNVITSLCKEYGIGALSISDCQGIYTYNNGKTVQENTLVLLLVNFKGEIVELTKHLKKALKQECIMIERLVNSFDFV